MARRSIDPKTTQIWTISTLSLIFIENPSWNNFDISSENFWPIYIAINELPVNIRFARGNIILEGVWQGKGQPPYYQYIQIFTLEYWNISTPSVLNWALMLNSCYKKCPSLLNFSYSFANVMSALFSWWFLSLAIFFPINYHIPYFLLF